MYYITGAHVLDHQACNVPLDFMIICSLLLPYRIVGCGVYGLRDAVELAFVLRPAMPLFTRSRMERFSLCCTCCDLAVTTSLASNPAERVVYAAIARLSQE